MVRSASLALILVSLAISMPQRANAAPYTNATRYLLKQQIKAGCDGKAGKFDHKGIYEVDLDGDGHLDLVLSHQGLACNRAATASSFCGAQFCSILIYHRQGKLLKKQDEFLGYILSFKAKPKPVFDIAHEGNIVRQWRPRTQDKP
nr:hypothetical protein [uncultured Cohaesibacter sp.]